MLRYLAVEIGDVTTAPQVVGVVVELHLLVLVVGLEVAVACRPRHGFRLCCFGRTIVTTEALTVYIVVIVLTVVRDVKRLVIVFNGLQLLTIFCLIVYGYTIRLIAGIRDTSWVCTITCKVAKLADNTLRADVDVLGVFATLSCNQVWADIEREACRTRITTRELGVTFSDYRLRLGNAQANLALHSTCAIIHINRFVFSAGLHRALTVGIIPIVAHKTVFIGCK